jgi:glutamate-1-semialdehyde 2,1-aminomutase
MTSPPTPATSVPEYRLPKSHEAFVRACRTIPGGVNSPARAFGAVGGEPPFMARAEGAYLFDIDGHRYIDYIGSWGPMILGHAHPRVRGAVVEALELGSSFGAPTTREIEIAEAVVAAVPSVEKVRFVSSGTEASMSAVRVARGVTGRDKIIKMAGHYHGHVDALLVQAGSAATTLGTPNSPGVTAGATADTILCPFNDLKAVAEAFARFPGQVAAVLLEPVAGNMGLVPPGPGYLEGLRELTRADGALLIFDEVMTGFRIAPGGAAERFGVTADLTTLGKVIGGGLPVAAYGGRRDLMSQVAPEGPVYQAGTLSGNPLAMAAGIATLTALTPALHDRIAQRTRALVEGLRGIAARRGVPFSADSAGSMFGFFFREEPVRSFTDAKTADVALFKRFFHAALARGVYLAPSAYEAGFTSAAHGDAEIALTLERLDAALAEATA